MQFQKAVFPLLLFFFMWFPIRISAQAAQASGTIRGTVRLVHGAGVPGAVVVILSPGREVVASAETNAEGAFSVGDIAPTHGDRLQITVGDEIVYDEPLSEAVFQGQPVDARLSSERAKAEVALLHPEMTVEVTATRQTEDLMTSANSVSVVTSSELKARNVQTVDEGLDQVPGLYVQRIQGLADTEASIFLRGFNGPNRTLVLLDGQPINDSFFGTVPWNVVPSGEVETIEIVRGPFSSLYGGNALGGVVSIRTRRPDRRSVDLQEEYGTNATNRLLAHYSEAIGKLGLVAGFQRIQFGGYENAPISGYLYPGFGTPVTGARLTTDPYGNPVAIVGTGGRNWLKQDTYRIAGDYAFSQKTQFGMQYIREGYTTGHGPYTTFLRDAFGHSVDNGTFQIPTPTGPQVFDITPGAFLQYPGARQTNFLSASFSHAFDDNRALHIDSGYNQIPSSNYTGPDYMAATLTGGPGTYTDTNANNFHTNTQYYQTAHGNLIAFGDEIRHDEAKNANYALSDWLDTSNRGAQTYLAYGQSLNEALYAQDESTLFSRLRVVAGGRYEYWKTYGGRINDYSSANSLKSYPDRSEQYVSGKIGASYTLPGGLILRASAGTAFRNPGIYELYATTNEGGIIYAANPNLNSEHVHSWEAGLRKSFGGSSNIDIAYYENRISSLIYRVADLAVDPSGNYLINVNAGSGRTRGVEFSLQQRILPWLTLRPSYTYTQAVVTANPDDPSTVDKYIPNIPKHMLSGELLAVRNKWTGAITARYSGATFETDQNLDTIHGVPGSYDPFFLLGASFTYRIHRHFELTGAGTNLLDRTYYQYYQTPGRQSYAGVRFKY